MEIWTKMWKLCISICQPGGTFSFLVRNMAHLVDSCLFLTTIPSVWLRYQKLMHWLEVAFCEEKHMCDLINMHLHLGDLLSKWANPRQLLELSVWAEVGVRSLLVWDQSRTTSCSPRGKRGLCRTGLSPGGDPGGPSEVILQISYFWWWQSSWEQKLHIAVGNCLLSKCTSSCVIFFFPVKSQSYKELQAHRAPAGISSVGMRGFSSHRAECSTEALQSGGIQLRNMHNGMTEIIC